MALNEMGSSELSASDAAALLVRKCRDAIRDSLAEVNDADAKNSSPPIIISQGLNRLLEIIIDQVVDSYLAATRTVAAAGEARYRAMFEQSPLPMWMLERTSLRFVAVNDAAVRHYGYTREEFAAMTVADLQAAGEAPPGADGPPQPETCQHCTKDGRLLTVEVSASDFTLDDKDVRLALVSDVTDRIRSQEALKRTEDQLRHAQKMDAIGRLAGGVAHDFNNVLTVIHSYACMLEESFDASDHRHDEAARIRRAAERGAGITRQLLAVSRHSVARPETIDVDELVEDFVPMLRRLVGATVTVVPHRGAPPPILMDPVQIEQVLMNLATNARDAMPGGGLLTIESRALEVDADTATVRRLKPGRYVELAVTDTGTGMDRETQQRIFDPFFTTKEVGKGTGLGLAISHGIITQAGGGISVYSEPGHGSTFRLYLPAIADGVAAAQRAPAPAPRALPPMRVLVVDDQPDIRAVAARILRDAGCSVIEAATADEARRLCVSHDDDIDLVLLDVVLSDVRTDALIHQLRELRPAMRFLQMSGYPVGALTSAGAVPDHLLVKPFTPSELRACVARVLGIDRDPMAASGSERSLRRRVIVVDDDDHLRRSVARLLRKAEFDVTDVDSGTKAIAALDAATFDVVVSDVQMPDGGGLELLRAIRRIDLDVPVILITGEPSVTAAASAIEYGAFRYLTKPLDTDRFVKTVQHAARAHALARLRREAFNVSGAHAGVADRAGLEVRFEQAVEGMWMAYQPIVHASTGVLFGVEALMRSSEPSIPHPLALLDAAANLGRLATLGRRVRALAATAFAPRGDDATLFINLHPDDLEDLDLVEATAPLSVIAPRVVLEVTERASLASSPTLTGRLARLRELGFRLAVDDIGAGYSGLASFTELTPELVKIDMSIVRDVHKSALKQRTIRSLCQLCHEVGTLVVGEGVETWDERDTLVQLGCDLLQGHLMGRPSRELPR
jgi:PAS domain S-box-containing protein